MEDIVKQILGTILSQCGAVSGVLILCILYLMKENARARTGWEKDRATALENAKEQGRARLELEISKARLETVVQVTSHQR